MTKPTFLLSTPVTPYPLQPWHDPATDIARQRFTKNQDIFTLSGHWHINGCHFIAQNISSPCIVLDHPRMEDFENEVKKGYDYVGISSLTPNMDDCLRMFELVRRVSPRSKTIFGSFAGYTFSQYYPPEEQKKWVDYLAYGLEGLHLMRRLSGEPTDGPMHAHFWPLAAYAIPWLDKYPARQQACLYVSLGCPQGCDFCTTTAQFGGQRYELLSPREAVEEVRLIRRRWPEVQCVSLLEEDSSWWVDYWQEFKRLIADDPDFRLDSYESFWAASIGGFAQWDDPDDWARLGLTNTFIGFESKFAQAEGYEKRLGDTDRIAQDLHKRGIANTGGFMLGFDFHDRQNIMEDIEWMVSLKPTSLQVSCITPYPGTPLFDRLMEEGRIRPFKWETVSFYGGGFVPKNFHFHELHNLITYTDKQLYETWGPTVMRQLEVDLEGYEYFIDHKDPKLRKERALLHKKKAHMVYPLIRACEQYAPNGRVRKLIKELEQRWRWNFGEPATSQKVMSEFIVVKAAQEKVRNFFNSRNREIHIEPPKKYIYGGGIKDHDEIPYKLLYLNRDKRYEKDRAQKALMDAIFGKVTSALNLYDTYVKGRELDPELTQTAKGVKML